MDLITNPIFPPTEPEHYEDLVYKLQKAIRGAGGSGNACFAITNMDTTDRPQIAQGSMCDVRESLFYAVADEDIGDDGTPADGVVHIKLIPNTTALQPTAVTAVITDEALPAWDQDRAGWYNAAGERFLEYYMVKSGTSYSSKGYYVDQNANSVKFFDGRISLGGGVSADGDISITGSALIGGDVDAADGAGSFKDIGFKRYWNLGYETEIRVDLDGSSGIGKTLGDSSVLAAGEGAESTIINESYKVYNGNVRMRIGPTSGNKSSGTYRWYKNGNLIHTQAWTNYDTTQYTYEVAVDVDDVLKITVQHAYTGNLVYQGLIRCAAFSSDVESIISF